MNAPGIFVQVVLPVFALIGIGVLMDRRFRLDLPTLTKLNFYVFVPALAFVKTLEADIGGATMGGIALFCLIHPVILFALAWALFSLRPLRPSRTVLSMGAAFCNCGNFGIPLVVLAFGDAQVGTLAIVIIMQGLLMFTWGVWLMEKEGRGPLTVVLRMVRVPVVVAVAAGLALRWLRVELPVPVGKPLGYLADGLIPVALLTLGAQLSRSSFAAQLGRLSALTAMRLVVSPLIAAAMMPLFGFPPEVGAVLVVAAGLPMAINVYIIAAEYEHDAELASQAVLWTTLASAVTLSVLLAVYR